MYKCKECGLEYKEKPDYCDCGNDEFEVIAEAKPEVKPKPKQGIQPKPEPIPQKTFAKPEPVKPKSFAEQYPVLARFFSSIDPISGGIFVLCLMLSVYVLLFAWNIDETQAVQKPKDTAPIAKNIPNSVDKFWNNALPVIKEEPKPAEPKIVEEVKKIITPQPKPAVQKPVQQVKTTPKTTTVKLTKNPVKNTVTQKPKTTTTTAKNTQKPAQTQVKTQQSAQTTQTTKPTQTTQTKQEVQQPTVQQKTAAEIAAEKAEKARQLAQAKLEYSNYKTALRNTIGRKIDFTKVVGDGSCTISFKINSSGKLVNAAFAKQSTNMTLNDAVYAAFMASRSYNPPPSAYNNETLNLNISFYNGNFEISLK